MNCSEVQELLSAYFDEELGTDERHRVSNHLNECANCTRDLARFGQLSKIAAALSAPVLPEQIWSQLEQRLEQQPIDDPTPLESVDQVRRRSIVPLKLFACAATVLVAVGIGWLIDQQSWFGYRHHEPFAAEFADYLQEFRRDPDAAQRILLARYGSQLVRPEDAIERVSYRPAVAGGLPAEYSLESTRILEMPCCTCLQSICKRNDGSTLAIFEHDDCSCNDQRCCIIEPDDRIAASWKRGARHMTLIGVRDDAEVSEMMAWLGRTR